MIKSYNKNNDAKYYGIISLLDANCLGIVSLFNVKK